MGQLLSVKDKKIIAQQSIQNNQVLTAQTDTAFVIDQPAAQTLPKVQVNADKTVVTLNSQESLVLDTAESAELFLHTSEQNYKLVYGQWTPVDSLPLDIVSPMPVSETVTLHTSAENVATLSGLADSSWLWGGLGIAALGGVGFALSKGGSSGSGSNSDTPESANQHSETAPNHSHTDTGTTPNSSTDLTNETNSTVSPDMTTGGQTGHTETNTGNNPPPISTPSNNNNNPPPLSPPSNNNNPPPVSPPNNNNGGNGNNNGGTGGDNNNGSDNNSGNNNSGNNNNPPSDGKLGVYVPKPLTDFVANVKDYGAKGDGQTDDTAALQKAVDAVAAKGGGIVDVPAGVYMLNAVTSRLHLKSNVILRMTDDTVLRAIPNDQDQYDLIRIRNADNVHIIGGTLEGERDAHQGFTGQWGHGVRIMNSTNVTIEKVIAKDFWGDGFYISTDKGAAKQSEGIVLYQVTADNNRRQGLSITDGKNIKVLDSVFKNTNGHMPISGIDIEPNPGQTVSDVEIRGNTFERNSGFGVIVSSSQYNGSRDVNNEHVDTLAENIRIINNKMIDNRDGIWINGLKGGVVSGNTIYNPDITAGPTGTARKLILDDQTHGVQVHNNTIYGGGDAKTGGGIDNRGTNNTIGENTYKSIVYIRGEVKSGEMLTAHVMDGDVVPAQVAYQWYANGQAITGATGKTYELSTADNGKAITVSVEFKDQAGHLENATSIASVPVNSIPPNQPPTYLYLSNRTLEEGKAGAVVGKFISLDANIGDTHTYRVSDDRFEVVNGELKLKAGQSVAFATEPTIVMSAASTDSAGATFVHTVTLQVKDDPNYPAPQALPKLAALAPVPLTDTATGEKDIQPVINKAVNLPLVENNATLFETPTLNLKDAGLEQPAQYNATTLHKDDGLGNVNNNIL